MSVRNFIRDNLPEPWERAATKLKMKTELIERLYGAVPNGYKNKYHYKKAIIYLRQVFREDCNIIYLVDATGINLVKWQKLNSLIIEYRHRCM